MNGRSYPTKWQNMPPLTLLNAMSYPYRMAEYAITCPNERHAMARSGQVKGRFRAAFEWQMADSSKHRADKWQHELLRLRAEKG